MKCPVCNKEMDHESICSHCGFDLSVTQVTPVTPVIPVPTVVNPNPDSAEDSQNSQDSDTPDRQSRKTGRKLFGIKMVLAVLVIVIGAACFGVWRKTTPDDVPAEPTDAVPTVNSPVNPPVSPEELFADQDALLDEGKRQAAIDAEVVNAMENLDNVIQQLVQKAEDAGDMSLAADRLADAYSTYISAVYRHRDMLDGQTLSGAIYKQIMSELDDAVSLGDYLTEKGCAVDTAAVKTSRDEFETAYTDKVIAAFDEFTTREMWSRTEAWNLMSATSDNMFDTSDLDNPVRLRYAYALSWWTQKQIETELNNGTITAKGAAIKIANMIDIMDYNPMMIHYYITFMNEAGEDCTDVSNAYNEIVEHLAQTQGIRIGEDIDLAHFWYFNDFVTHSVDDTNGVTQENRQWIRGRMSYVTFIK